ncbi:alanyl-tRNA synthetase [Serratia symbiotica str. 'Cinara cedri']|nr:alanyl-tRNA synthetase [Serratia symbiotica str. 'Cinara cedri']
MNKSTADIRQAFLNFFSSKGHYIVASSSLIPNNDSTLLFTNAGMNQFKNIFLGVDKQTYSQVTTSQCCMRAGGKHNDLENVGYTARHHTFFEMLGNFSFGAYFKREAISYAWELLTKKDWFGLSKEKLWVTVYEADDESFDIWQKHIGLPAKHIIRIGDNKDIKFSSDNFWQMGDTGPCGPCTEIFYDQGEHISGLLPGSAEEVGDRYIEIWNIVFMQFNRQSNGIMVPLPKPSVDTGMGLERIAAVLQNVSTNYEIDIFRILMTAVAKVTSVADLDNKSLRVIADHIRACAFLISDGVIPSNEGRGYVLRRIIRRAIRHGYILGVKNTFFYQLVAPLIDIMGTVAFKLKSQQSFVEQVLKTEEEQFSRTLVRGMALLDHELNRLQDETLDGEIAFRLYDTFGFPIDLTTEICRERGLKVDKVRFERAMDSQRRRARESSNFSVDYNTKIHMDISSGFSGYVDEEHRAIVIALLLDGHLVDKINTGEVAIVVLDRTPFYGEAGGQVGDTGVLKTVNACFVVNDTQKYNKAIYHLGVLSKGTLKLKDHVNAQIDVERRNHIRLNHSATHLLHAALRQILGNHVKQKGSLVNDKYLRFDFAHFESMKPEQIRSVEDLVNKQVRRNLLVHTEVISLHEAKEKGVLVSLRENYGSQVRLLIMGDFSSELCSGTHVSSTGDIGLFRILTESGTAAGVRRIEAVTGEEAIAKLHQQSDLLQVILNLLKGDSSNITDKICATLDRIRVLEKELQQLKNQRVAQESLFLSSQVKVIYGVKLLVSQLYHVDVKMLRIMVDDLKNKLGTAIIVLATIIEDKVRLVVGVTKDLTDRVKAEELIRSLANQIAGKGGGRIDMAQAGGTNVSALPAALDSIENWVMSRLSI